MRSQKDKLGDPLQANNLGERFLDPLIAKAGVKRITVHGLRHTVATQMLDAKIPVHTVAERLGHSDVQITWSTYTHVLRGTDKAAADVLAAVLHGKG